MAPKRAAKTIKTGMKAGPMKKKAISKVFLKADMRAKLKAAAKGKATGRPKAKAKGKAKAKAKAKAAPKAQVARASLSGRPSLSGARAEALRSKEAEKLRKMQQAWEAQEAKETAKAIRQIAALQAQEAMEEASKRASSRAKQLAQETTRGVEADDDPSMQAFREQFRARAREVLGLGPREDAAESEGTKGSKAQAGSRSTDSVTLPEHAPAPSPRQPQARRPGAWKEDDATEQEYLMMGFAAEGTA